MFQKTVKSSLDIKPGSLLRITETTLVNLSKPTQEEITLFPTKVVVSDFPKGKTKLVKMLWKLQATRIVSKGDVLFVLGRSSTKVLVLYEEEIFVADYLNLVAGTEIAE